MIRIVDGSLLDATEDILGHQTNTKGVWGAGIAKQFKMLYPRSYKFYQHICNEHRDSLLGKCAINHIENGKYIACLFGQRDYGRDSSKVYTDYDALRSTLYMLKIKAMRNGHSIAIPYGIGCGLGGASWSKVYEIIESVFDDYDVTLYKI